MQPFSTFIFFSSLHLLPPACHVWDLSFQGTGLSRGSEVERRLSVLQMLSPSPPAWKAASVSVNQTHAHKKANLYHGGFMGPGIYGTALALGCYFAGRDEKQTVIQDRH